MDMTKIRRFAELDRLKKEKSGELDKIKEELAELEQAILEDFAEEGVARISVTNGVRDVTVHTTRKIRAQAAQGQDPDAVAAACQAAGLGHLVKERANMQTLSSFVRELDEAGEDLPPELEGVVVKIEEFKVGARAS